MRYLGYEDILASFLRATGMKEEEFRHISLIETAEAFVLSHLNIEPEQLNDMQKILCEQAAAAVAVYDYCFELCLKERPVMSENGEVSIKCGCGADALAAAKERRDDALSRLVKAKIGAPESFAFLMV